MSAKQNALLRSSATDETHTASSVCVNLRTGVLMAASMRRRSVLCRQQNDPSREKVVPARRWHLFFPQNRAHLRGCLWAQIAARALAARLTQHTLSGTLQR